MYRAVTLILTFLFVSFGCITTSAFQSDAAGYAQQGHVNHRGDARPVGWVTDHIDVPHLKQEVFHSRAAKSDVSYYVYTPDEYYRFPNKKFPVIYWLHGGGGGIKFLRPVSHLFNQAIESGDMPPALVIFPNGMKLSNWVNSKDGKIPMETVVINGVRHDVESKYRTINTRKGRSIGGFSMGGYGAAHLGMKYPELFGSISIFSGGPLQTKLTEADGVKQNARARLHVFHQMYGDDQEYFKKESPWKLAEKNANKLKHLGTVIRIVVGDKDFLFSANKKFSDHLGSLKIPHDFIKLHGVEHNPSQFFRKFGRRNWAFYRRVF